MDDSGVDYSNAEKERGGRRMNGCINHPANYREKHNRYTCLGGSALRRVIHGSLDMFFYTCDSFIGNSNGEGPPQRVTRDFKAMRLESSKIGRLGSTFCGEELYHH